MVGYRTGSRIKLGLNPASGCSIKVALVVEPQKFGSLQGKYLRPT